MQVSETSPSLEPLQILANLLLTYTCFNLYLQFSIMRATLLICNVR